MAGQILAGCNSRGVYRSIHKWPKLDSSQPLPEQPTCRLSAAWLRPWCSLAFCRRRICSQCAMLATAQLST